MKQKMILLFFMVICIVSWKPNLEKDIFNTIHENLGQLKRIAIIEFAVLPPEYIETGIHENQIVCIPYHDIQSGLNASLLTAIIAATQASSLADYQNKIYPQMVRINSMVVNDIYHVAEKYWNKKAAGKIINTKELFSSSAYRSLPEKGIKTYSLDLSNTMEKFPRFSIPKGSYNFFDVTKSYNVLKYGEYLITEDEFSPYNTSNTEGALEKGKKLSSNFKDISRSLNVDATAVITISVATRAYPEFYQHLLIRMFVYDSNGFLITPVMFLGKKMKGEPSDIVHYEHVLREFDNVFAAMMDIFYFKEW